MKPNQTETDNTVDVTKQNAGEGVVNFPTEDNVQQTADSEPTTQPNQEKIKEKQIKDSQLDNSINAREMPATGDPDASVADPQMIRVKPRYRIVQNQSIKFLIIPDLKAYSEDRGLTLEPGEYSVLTDFYTPQEINRSRGLRYAATEEPGLNGKPALIPLSCEEDAAKFVLPEKKKYPKGTQVEDLEPNDFDERFEELEKREAKREEKLLKKTLGMRRTKQHGSAPQHV